MPDQIVLCIPGPWKDRSAFIAALARASDGRARAIGESYKLEGSDASCDWLFEPDNPGMAEAFRVSLMPDEAHNLPERIARHLSVVYLIGSETGSDAAQQMVSLSLPCLDAGGMGVKVEAAGKAFSDAKWRILSASVLKMREQFVLYLVAGEGGYWSCGNHQLGQPDTFVETDDYEEALRTARVFESYLESEQPTLNDNDTFRENALAPRWRINRVAHPYHGAGPIDRSLGMWKLSKVH